MKKLFIYIPFAMQFVATLLLLSVACVSSSELPSGEMEGQWEWLSRTGIIYALCVGLSLLFYFRKAENSQPDYAYAVVWALIIIGGWEALFGLRQLYGFTYSNHSLFPLTGSFFNPGPYSGYLAMIFPMGLSEYFRLKECSKHSLPAKIGYYFVLIVLFLIFCALPAGMSRSAWLAAGTSSLFVTGYYCHWIDKLKVLWRWNRRRFISWGILGLVCLAIGLATLFYIKKDSANGRLFMWKISLHAIAEKPLAGHGPGGFHDAYGAAQEAYFANGTYSEWEEHVAGSPEYAFNEYLQLAIEFGIPVLICFMTLVVFCFWRGLKKQRVGICGAILSLAIFAFSSYPLQLPVFIITLIVLLFSCVAGKRPLWLLLFSLAIGTWSVYLWRTNDYEACKKWTHVRVLYNVGAYKSANEEYAGLYSELKDRKEFMFEYGRCLQKMNAYNASNQILQEASLLTCDPMVFNLIGKNHQMKGEYNKAEEYFLRSVNRLPGRIYPYYLLAKLYAEPDFFQSDKFEYAARMVMEKEPKVQSTAIKEMRDEIRQLQEEMAR